MSNKYRLLSLFFALFSLESIAQSTFQILIDKSHFAGANNVSCLGASDGKIIVSASGADRLNLKLFKTGELLATATDALLPHSFTGLNAGYYSLEASNSDTSIFMDSIQLFQASALRIITNSVRPVSCQPGADGEVKFSVSGGAEPYSFFWNEQLQTDFTVSGLTPGSYNVEIIDANGCQMTMSVSIPQASLPSFQLITSPVNSLGFHLNCATDNDAWIRLDRTNTLPGDQVSWRWRERRVSYSEDPILGLDTMVSYQNFYFSNTDELSSIGAGTYVVSVQNQYGCKATDSVEILSPFPFKAKRLINCNPDFMDACQCPMFFLRFNSIVGGVEPYTLNGQVIDATSVQSLTAGSSYSFMLKDQAGCEGTPSFQLDANEALLQEICPNSSSIQERVKIGMVQKSQYAGYNTTASHSEDGEIEFKGIGGRGQIQYRLKNLLGTLDRRQNTGKFDELAAGDYIIEAKDSLSGEKDSAFIRLKAPTDLVVQIQPQLYSPCESNTGLMTSYVTGGTPGYKFRWTYESSDGQIMMMDGDLTKIVGEGLYTLEVWDANDQRAQASYFMEPWSPFSISAEVIELGNGYHTRCDQADGRAILALQGGLPPFRIEIVQKGDQNNSSHQTLVAYHDSAQIQGLGPGYYLVYVSDSMGCKTETSLEVKSPESTQFKLNLEKYSNGYYFSCSTCADAHVFITSSGVGNQFTWFRDDMDYLHTVMKIEGASSVNYLADLTGIDLSQLTNLGNGAEMTLTMPEGKYLVVSKNESGCLSAACIQLEAPRQETLGWNLHGNQNVDSTFFVGTSDNTSLLLKSNNLLGLKITPDGKVEAPSALKTTRLESPELGTFSAQDVSLKVNGINAIYLKANTNIGIGTNLPQAKLDVNGNSLLNGEAKIMGNLILPNLPAASVDPYANMDVLGLSANGMVSKMPWSMTKDGCYTAPVDSSTSTPQFGLMPFWEDDINKIYTMCGNVGVGTNNPTSKLHVNGSGRFENDITAKGLYGTHVFLEEPNLPQNASILSMEASNSTLNVYPNLVGAGYNYITKPGDIGLIWTNANTGNLSAGLVIAPKAQATSGLRIDNAGRVTISTTTPLPSGFMLGVGGSIICEELDVRLQGEWGDFVFDKDYKRLSLKELKAYLDNNKHMPGYPSAKDIAQKAYLGIGENIQNLTIKTEEAFLYLIDLNDRLEKLEIENNQLKKLLSQTY